MYALVDILGVEVSSFYFVLPPDCVDNHPYCAWWAEKGECNRNPGYMNSNCKESCNKCEEGKFKHLWLTFIFLHTGEGSLRFYLGIEHNILPMLSYTGRKVTSSCEITP